MPVRSSRALVTTAVLVPAALGMLLLLLTAGPPPTGELVDPGPVTRWGLPPARAVRDVVAALTVGFFVAAAFILPGRARPTAVRAGAVAGTAWVGAGLVVLVLTLSDIAGVPSSQLGSGVLLDFVTGFDIGRAMVASMVFTALAVVAARLGADGWAAVLAVLALAPLALTGHAAGSANHELGVNSQFGHLVGVSVWMGGLVAMVVVARQLSDDLSVAASRWSKVALAAYLLVAVSGLGASLARLDSWSALGSTYGVLLLVKVAIFLLLGFAGWWHRRHVLARAGKSLQRKAFLRLAALEVVVMAVAVGFATALSRTPPPVGADPDESTAEALLGETMPPSLGADLHWLTQWRIDSLWVPVSVVAVALYAVGVRRLRLRGDRWPVGRTVAWVLGWTAMVVATSASPGVYARLLFSMHMVQHMTIALLVPSLLVFGAPVTLAMRALPARRDGTRGPREWLLAVVHSRALAFLGNPMVAAGLFVASMGVFYYSPLFELALRTHSGHVLMTIHFLLSGYLLASAVVGVDPGPKRPPYPFRLVLITATFGFHALFAVSLMASTQVLAWDWFSVLPRVTEKSLKADQDLGAQLGWALGDYPVAILAAAMAIGWIRSDSREARRYDRKAARDGDADLAAYNEHLQRLGEQTRRAGDTRSTKV
jgi:putative copper resistance protein D